MNKNDLKNGMSFKIRKGNMNYIINNRVYVNTSFHTLSDDGTLDQYIENLNDDMTVFVRNAKNYDIMKVFDIDGKLIWERQEVDWTKIPKDTKIWVKDFENCIWKPRYFAKYENEKVYAYDSGKTSWSCGDESPLSWDQCKLAEKLKEEKPHITWDYIMAKFEKFCKEQNCDCTYCDYEGFASIDDCRIEWIKDNFDKIIKEHYSES